MLRHHLPVGFATGLAGFLLYVAHPQLNIIERLSFASAYPALILISTTLLIGPIKLISGKRVPISMDLRRDIGIWAGVSGVSHALVGQFVHLRGRPWLYYVYDDWPRVHSLPIRYDVFGLANDTGLLAALILLLLLATSNDASLRKLRTPGWKKLQRWNYVCFGLVAIHTLLYQEALESQTLPFLSLALITVGFTILVQYRGFRLRTARAHAGVREESPPTAGQS
jgi:methionine sulfoxide reductase heme-binding subunit